MKLLSVIVLSYNNSETLYETIDSILIQDYSSIEIIVADDCSNSFNCQQVNNYIFSKKKSNIVSCIVYQNDSNIGTVKSLNTAIKKSSGDYIKIIAGDDAFSSENVFSTQVSCLDEKLDSYFVVSDIVQCDKSLKPIESLGFYNHKININSLFVTNRDKKAILRFYPYLLSTQAICFKRVFFYRYCLFDERYRLIEDLPFLVKVLDNRIPFSYVKLDSVMHRCDVGISSKKTGFFDLKKIDYYKDLYNYFCFDLSKYKKIVGKFNFCVRKNIALFKLQYTLSRSKLLFIKFFPVLIAYLFVRK